MPMRRDIALLPSQLATIARPGMHAPHPDYAPARPSFLRINPLRPCPPLTAQEQLMAARHRPFSKTGDPHLVPVLL